MVGFFSWGAESSPTMAKLLEPMSALCVSICSGIFHYFVPESCYFTIILSSVIWILPGLSLTIAIMELSTRNMISGTSRMFYSFLILLELGFGIEFGTKLVFWTSISLATAQNQCLNSPVNPLWFFLLFFGTAIPFVILFEAHPNQWPPMMVSASLAIIISYFGQLKLDTYSVSFISSFAIGIFGTIYSRFSKKPSMVTILPGIMMLVPGSIGVRGISEMMLSGDVVSGISFSFEMMTISLSITVGLLFAHLIVYPKKVLTPILL
jgi:uncharacterized membrane protein YjjB (DUF3815 family)